VRSWQTGCASWSEIPTFIASLCNSGSNVLWIALHAHVVGHFTLVRTWQRGLLWRRRGIASVFPTSPWGFLGFLRVESGFTETFGVEESAKTSYPAPSCRSGSLTIQRKIEHLDSQSLSCRYRTCWPSVLLGLSHREYSFLTF
jgi:hypothetical protein